MYRQPRGHRPHGGSRGAAPPPPSQPPPPPFNPNFLQTPNLYIQNPNFLITPNPFLQNPNFSFQFQSPNFPIQKSNFPQRPPRPNEAIEKIDRAVVKARQDLLAAGETVSAWKVCQAALLTLQVDSWDSLGFHMQQVPSLHRLIVIEGKINAFIHCFVAARRITSLYDLEVAICQNEGVERFEELELGPLVRHPLVVHYFSVSSDMTEVFRITSEQIIYSLCEFRDTHTGKEIKMEELLDFIAEKRSVTGREKLGVRIQSLGMHIALIKQARQSGNTVLQKCLEGLKTKPGKNRRKRPLFSSQKKQLDDHFSNVSERIKSFSSENEDFCGKHIKFISSSSDDDDDSAHYENEDGTKDVQSDCKPLSQNINSSDQVSGCPYPSAAEEIMRLGLKSEMNGNSSSVSGSLKNTESNGPSKRKRKSENISCTISAPHKLPKRDKVESDLSVDGKKMGRSNLNEADYILSNDSMRMFITTWKEACLENNVAEILPLFLLLDWIELTLEIRSIADAPLSAPTFKGLALVVTFAHKFSMVFERMLQLYKPKKRQQVRKMFSSYPCVGLLNVAVTSIKCGMWDSMYDALQTLSQQGVVNTILDKSIDYISIEVEPAEKDAVVVTEHTLKCKHGITVEDIIKRASTYFEPGHDILGYADLPLEKKFIFLKKLCKCEFWLTEQFCVKEFESLGYGEFFKFLEKNFCLLPHSLQKWLAGDRFEKLALEACMIQHQLCLLLSQASNSLWENESISKQRISELLMRQFPSVCFKIVESGSLNDLRDIVRVNENNVVSNCVLFSATLLGMGYVGDTSAHNEKKISEAAGVETEIGRKAGTLGYVTTKDAIEVLLRAPMLTDLDSWSHWDLIFSPSLGPLLGWLLNEVNNKELMCLVTKGGKVIRIDQSATVDSFLEAFLQGSSFQTAVELLSLFSLYGGDQNVPLSLLKRHAQQAFEVIVNNFMGVKVNFGQNSVMHEKPLCSEPMLDENRSGSKLHKNSYGANKAGSTASRFILDCLGCLPMEFRSFAADVLLSGLGSVVKDVYSVILDECKQVEQRLMLHEVGLSLGIVEWISDYHTFSKSTDLVAPGPSCLNPASSELSMGRRCAEVALDRFTSSEDEMMVSAEVERHSEEHKGVRTMENNAEISSNSFGENRKQNLSKQTELDRSSDPVKFIESIRRDEFGLDPSLSVMESNMLKKQHARLGRALHCLSQELYSQDSHFLLELVQNADDNVYPGNVEPTLSFILQEGGIIVLNNEQGFSAENIRALCDVGNSTKRGSTAGYIGKKGIGFKSVFRVTDAPEIHSNGFHIKFDISEGQIGFVLPTVVPPCDIDFLSRLASVDTDQREINCWNTCIVIPFRSKFSEGFAMNSIISMFSDLHPSLLLFLHRLQCIKFRNMLNDSLIVMKKEVVGNGIIKVSHGKEIITWFVASQKLQADVFRPDVQSTEIAIAFTLQELDNMDYIPLLEQQPVFAFLPLRTYGLKFILQGDFILPSSREEVDGDSPWNQWLLSEFPGLFVNAERSFCSLPCFRENPGKAVAAFMSFVPLVGEVHGFFSSLPRMIVSRLRMSNCLLLEGENNEWVPPCKVLRNWTEQARALLPDSLLREHLGLGLLNRDIVLSDSLARALGVEEYGPKILIQIMSCLCCTANGLKLVGLCWLSSWLNAIYLMSFHSSGKTSLHYGNESDLTVNLRKIPFIPLTDGKYSSVDDGPVWLHSDALNSNPDNECGSEAFPKLYAKLRTVNPALFSVSPAVDFSCSDTARVENLTMMLYRVGVQRLSAHEIVKLHILPAISCGKNTIEGKCLMTEYLSFVMFHLHSNCSNCFVEREHIISELHNKALILTNHGYKRPVEVSIHFNKEFGNRIDVKKLINGIDVKWHEVDITYLKHPITKLLPDGMLKWRKFLEELGITDFVQVVQIEKCVADISHVVPKNMTWERNMISPGSFAKDWESRELVDLMSQLSSSGDRERYKYLLEILDTLWDDCFGDKVTGYCNFNSTGENTSFKSTFMGVLHDFQWIVSSMDDELHYPKDLFHDCEAVRSILGGTAPYAVPKLRSEKLLKDIGFKDQVSLDDIFSVLQVWRRCETPFKASGANFEEVLVSC
ncbi:unnamed protein product [Ilex paraguariensis]|uniref:Sacsin/Nov domain-containing protein n=1 Tax=Ilex paraguariensis TaxID=185542 RepID=A0ABC8QVT1_9AQUA